MTGKKEMKVNPYIDTSNIRTFSKNVDPMELVWHQDNGDRLIEVLEGEEWMFQRDDELPKLINKGDYIFIPDQQIHRIHKGNTDLKIKIHNGQFRFEKIPS
jgi:hypothetical protein